MKIKVLLLFLVQIICFGNFSMAQVIPLINAHSHNDYSRIPLFPALEHGFMSIEADILLIEDDLYVGHDMPGANQRITLPDLEESYLYPLDSVVRANDGQIYANTDEPVLLMIDIKTDAKATYEVLNDQLLDYRDMLTYWEGDKVHEGPILIFISGNRDFEGITNEEMRFVALDGRPGDLGKGYSTAMMPVISEDFAKVCKWNGKGEIKPKEFEKIKVLADKTHAEGKRLRLWATPEGEHVWKMLLEAGVDILNADDLGKLQDFLLNRANK